MYVYVYLCLCVQMHVCMCVCKVGFRVFIHCFLCSGQTLCFLYIYTCRLYSRSRASRNILNEFSSLCTMHCWYFIIYILTYDIVNHIGLLPLGRGVGISGSMVNSSFCVCMFVCVYAFVCECMCVCVCMIRSLYIFYCNYILLALCDKT